MARFVDRPPHQGGLSNLRGSVTLAIWQLRLTWRLLVIVAAGVIAAVMLVCVVPLYSQVAMSAGLRDALNASPDSSIVIHSEAHLISLTATQQVAGQIQQDVQPALGPFLEKVQFALQSPGLPIDTVNQLQLNGWSMSDVRPHVKVLAGRLPADGESTLDTALTARTASSLGLTVGSAITVSMSFLNAQGNQILYPLTLHVVGIFAPLNPGDYFWHGTSFVPQSLGVQGMLYPALVADDSYIAALSAASMTVSQGNLQNGTSFEDPTDLYWYYNFAVDRLDINQLDALSTGLNNVLVQVSNQPVDEPFIDKTTSTGPQDLISNYADRVSVARIPLLSLAYLIAGLMLFFVSLMTDLLVDRQSEAIAVLRSRGASRQQIFSSLIVQSIGVGIIAFLGGPLLSILVARWLAGVSLAPVDQGALNVILADPLSAALNLYLAALATVVVSILAMVFAISRAARMDVLSLRREAARATQGPVWLRMGLDMLAGVIALTGYGFSVYITTPGILDARTRVLILPPMTLVGAVFLLLGCMLLFLRVFPFILELFSRLAVRGRGATSLLAVSQMARAPRQSLRMTLLLALAVAFGIFSLVFSASQSQRIPGVAAYQIGADFSGTYADNSMLSTQPIGKQEAAFQDIPGVQAASVGYVSSTRGAESGVDASIELRAVDASTFGRVGIWTSQDSATYSLNSLMKILVAQRRSAVNTNVVPAIVDAAAWQTLSLSPGAPFTLSDLNGTVNYVAVGEVDHLPSIIDSDEASGTDDYVAEGGVLIDFSTYQTVLENTTQATIHPSTVWLNTDSNATALTSVRMALATGPTQLIEVSDLYAQENAMDHDPLYLALLGVLAIGTVTALLLGLLGNLTVSWLSARSRVGNFAVMRALGTLPQQVASILTYEQAIIYATAIGLGVAFGLLLSFLILPAFVFTSSVGNAITDTGIFYIAQDVPPIQMIIPGVLIAMAVGILVAVCVLALGMMVRIVSRPSLSNILRLNGD